jgi:hypothetical protein
MDPVLACAICGMDAASDTILINAAIAAGLGTPWILRERLVSAVRRTWRRMYGRTSRPSDLPFRGAADDARKCPSKR